MVEIEDVLDAREAANYLRINEQTVRRLARDSEIPAFKVGGSWRFKRSSLDRWSDLQERRPKAKQRSVLVIDDEEVVRGVLKATLEGKGFQVTAVAGGADVIPLLAERKPDVVFLDLKMPRMDGPTVLKKIRDGWGAVPVIVLTGYPDSDLMHRALEHSPITLLAKPSSPGQILQAVDGILGN
ncbi:MAG: response regulator [Acidobacteriota bacterium]